MDAVLAVHDEVWLLVNDAADTHASLAKHNVESAVGTGQHWRGMEHPSSAPGQIDPVYQTGDLVESIHVVRMPLGPSTPACDVVCDDPAIGALEHGSPHMAPRPFMSEALHEAIEMIEVETTRIHLRRL